MELYPPSWVEGWIYNCVCLSKLRSVHQRGWILLHVKHTLTLKVGLWGELNQRERQLEIWEMLGSKERVFPMCTLNRLSVEPSSYLLSARPSLRAPSLTCWWPWASSPGSCGSGHSIIHSFIHLLNRYLTLACSVPGPVLGTRNIVTSKAGLALFSRALSPLRWINS